MVTSTAEVATGTETRMVGEGMGDTEGGVADSTDTHTAVRWEEEGAVGDRQGVRGVGG